MFDLSKIFSNKSDEAASVKDEVAKLLKISPDALRAFEKSYKENALNTNEVSENFFNINAKQMKKLRDEENKEIADDRNLDQIIDTIVMELLAKSSVYSYDREDGVKIENLKALPSNFKKITNREIKNLPENIRPELTGELMKIDLAENSYEMVFAMYQKYIKTNNKMFYHQFRQGLDILDLDPIVYETLGMNQTSMGNWLPQLVNANTGKDFFKIPSTKILKVPMSLLQLTRQDYQGLTPTTMKILDKYTKEVFKLDNEKDYFIKTGTYSSKFDFRNAKVTKGKEVDDLGQYLLFIHFQALQMASPLSTPSIYGVSTTNEWVVREFIEDKEDNPQIYMGLPLHTEYRVFVDCNTKEVLSVANYWDEEVMLKRFGHESDKNDPHKMHDYITYQMHKETLYKRFNENKTLIKEKVQELILDLDLTGQWSIDVMQNGDDFWLIDMATAETSAFYDTVPKEKRIEQNEKWIPQIALTSFTDTDETN